MDWTHTNGDQIYATAAWPLHSHGCPTYRCKDLVEGKPPAGVKRGFVDDAYCQ